MLMKRIKCKSVEVATKEKLSEACNGSDEGSIPYNGMFIKSPLLDQGWDVSESMKSFYKIFECEQIGAPAVGSDDSTAKGLPAAPDTSKVSLEDIKKWLSSLDEEVVDAPALAAAINQGLMLKAGSKYEPKKGSNVAELQRLLAVASEKDASLMAAYVAAMMKGSGPEWLKNWAKTR